MGNKKTKRKLFVVLTVLVMFFSNLSFAIGAELNKVEPTQDKLITGTDFENDDPFGFVPGGGTTVGVKAETDGNKYLELTGNGNGGRSIVKTFDTATTDGEVLFTFDWKPEDVTTDANSSEILFSDVSNNPIFRIVKVGGPNGEIKYEVGSAGTVLPEDQSITGVSTDGRWLSVKVLFDFINENVSLEIQDKNDETKSFEAKDIDFGSINYVNSLAKIAVNGNRASGNTLSFITGLDNLSIYGSGVPAPSQEDQNIVSIVTEYNKQLQIPKEVAKQDVITFFPSILNVQLEDGLELGVNVNWDSIDYNPSQIGTYTFTGVLNTEGIPNVVNGNDIKAEVTVAVTEQGEIPEVEGYTSVYYSDFGDTVEVVPVNWGFTTAAATLSINKENILGNNTPKLQFSIENQSGGRVATKNFDTAVKGKDILVKFDWYPGKNNDKGDKLYENGAELRIIDSSNNTIFTINNTNNEPLSYFARGQAPVKTNITDPEAWYSFEINFNQSTNKAKIKITNQAGEIITDDISSLEGASFDGSIASVKIVGIRTSGNNHSLTTYLDNFGVYSIPVTGRTLYLVDKLPYHRVYVNETTEEISSIGLPETVAVTLADNSKVDVAISEWKETSKEWNPSEPGIYQFEGTFADTEGIENSFNKKAKIYVYNRLTPPKTERQTEWLDRGVIALSSEDGIFVSWRLLADEYSKDVKFNVYRNGEKLNAKPLAVTNYVDPDGKEGDTYKVETIVNGKSTENNEAEALGKDYLSIPMQKPEGGTTATGDYTYTVNDSSVGDLDGDGEYELIVKWYPTNAIDSSQTAMTGPTIFDAYKLDGTLLWRINMGLNLTSGAHYHQFIVADFDGNGKSEFLIKTADATTSYGTTDGKFDSNKVISVIGNAENNGKYLNDSGHVIGGPEYISVFNGETGEVIDTIDYTFPLEKVEGDQGVSWGDTWYNRSDRYLAGLAYLDGKKPSAIYGRGYYERTSFVAYSLVDGKLVEEWTFDSDEEGRGASLGYHSLATGDVDNDGFDEIIAGSLTLDQDGSILYAMDGEMQREQGSHGDALHVGAFDPDREGLHVFGVHEVPAVASVELHDGATGETLMSYYASVDAGRGVAANITSSPGYEFWGTGGSNAETGGGIYNVQGNVEADSFRNAGLSVNFALYWDGDLLQELLDDTSITKYNEETGKAELVKAFEGVVSNNGTKATPTLQADILGDWREEVVLPSEDSSEIRVFSTTIPTEYRIFTLMHDGVYRNAVAWQNVAYNQPPHIGFYLGEDIRETVLAGELDAPTVVYTNKVEEPTTQEPGDEEESTPEESETNDGSDQTDNENEKDTGNDLDEETPTNKDGSDAKHNKPGNELPITATSMYNYLIFGLVLLAAGLSFAMPSIRKRLLNR